MHALCEEIFFRQGAFIFAFCTIAKCINNFYIMLKISYECTEIFFNLFFYIKIIDKHLTHGYNIFLRLKWKEMPYN